LKLLTEIVNIEIDTALPKGIRCRQKLSMLLTIKSPNIPLPKGLPVKTNIRKPTFLDIPLGLGSMVKLIFILSS
jgi:hypothetical protein